MGEMMRAVVKPARGPGAEMREVPVPVPGDHDVLIRVKATSMCGTDLHIFRWDQWAEENFGETPMVFGHEYCGDVVEIGRDVSSVKVGDFVSGETHIGCGHCHLCRTGQQHICINMGLVGVTRPGCFAEYIAIPERERLGQPARSAGRHRRHSGAVRQRRPYRPLGRDRRTLDAGDGLRADRPLRYRHRQSVRRGAHLGGRHPRLSAGAGAQDGRFTR